MRRYNIADLIVDISHKGDMLAKRIEKYEVSADASEKADIIIDIDPAVIEKRAADSELSIGYSGFEFMMTGNSFYRQLIDFNGFMLHASAVVLDGKAYLFSAPSGTGKSTHTSLWMEYFKDRDVYIINDDKPAIRLRDDGKFYVSGTPWSGKTAKNVNTSVPLQAICFLERSESNFIEKIDAVDALKSLIWQTLRPTNTESLDKLIAIQDSLLKKIPVYKMGCDMSFDAVELAYNTMK